jgi:hypothetical protein
VTITTEMKKRQKEFHPILRVGIVGLLYRKKISMKLLCVGESVYHEPIEKKMLNKSCIIKKLKYIYTVWRVGNDVRGEEMLKKKKNENIVCCIINSISFFNE